MILDNKQNGLVGDTLKKYLTKDASLSLVTNQFSIFSYRHLQKEIEDDTGIKFGLIEEHAFANIVTPDENGEEAYHGLDKSEGLWKYLYEQKYIDDRGKGSR